MIYHAAGWLEGGLTASFEKFVIDCEVLQQIIYTQQSIKIDDKELALAAVREVGHDGHFFGCSHTQDRYKSAYYSPLLSDWSNFESWEEAGAVWTHDRANHQFKQILHEYEPPHLDPAINEELQEFVANALKKAARQQIIESAYPVLVTGLTLENNINMKTQAKVVVIGGGVVGTSVLYHLTKLGCKDVMLVERSDLTSGSTWHAAGGMHTINGDPNVAKLQQYTISLYKEIEELSGQDIGLHMTGGVMLAATQERFDWLKGVYAKGKYLGMDDLEIISAKRAAELMPLLDPTKFVGALYDPIEGHCDPYGVTHAYAKAARKNGAIVETQTKVDALSQDADGTWKIKTIKGEIKAEHIVNAGGLWAREIGRMVGLELPVLAMEHMYLLTEDMPRSKPSTRRQVLKCCMLLILTVSCICARTWWHVDGHLRKSVSSMVRTDNTLVIWS